MAARTVGGVDAADAHGARGGRLEGASELHGRGLAGAGAADERAERAGLEREADPVERRGGAGGV